MLRYIARLILNLQHFFYCCRTHLPWHCCADDGKSCKWKRNVMKCFHFLSCHLGWWPRDWRQVECGMWHVGQMKLNLQFNNTNYRDNNMRINNKLLAHSYRYLQQPNIRNTTTTPTNSLYTYSMLMPAIGISCSCYCPRLI